MVRPDNKVLDNQSKFIFSLLEIRSEKHANYDLDMIRIGLVKKNNWYGSLLEIHKGIKDGEKTIVYFDILFTRYLKSNRDIKANLSSFFDFSSITSSIKTIWNVIDKFFYIITNNPLWSSLNGLLKKITPNTKGQVGRHAN
jgi:hypothetical protein